MRLLYFLTHPIQYQSPLIRFLRANGVNVEVIYGTDAGSRRYFDPGFSREICWDVPLLEGYPHTVLNHEEPTSSRRKQLSHYAAQIDEVMRRRAFDAFWVHGWHHPLINAAWDAAQRHRKPLLLRGETFLGCVKGGKLRRCIHRLVFSRRFRRVKAFLAVGSLNHQLYRAYGVEESKIFQMPYAVDNVFFQVRAEAVRVGREALRERLGIMIGQPIILFCGKLLSVKDPATLIRAVGRMVGLRTAPILLLAGDGELRTDLEVLARQVAPECVKFLGFQNQTELPALYDLCDVFVLPSRFEPWGLVVNEVMNAGKPVIVSDQVGSGADLVLPGENGEVFRAGDVDDLIAKLSPWLLHAEKRQHGGRESLRRIRQWGFEQCLLGMKNAIYYLESLRHA